jgi:CheY-like chemotaxis protein
MKAPLTVLLVEDDQDDQFFFIEAIGEIENVTLYAVANNGKEALDLLQHSVSRPDLIFTDLNMPVMDGLECLSEIMNNPETKGIPVVVLSTDCARTDQACKLGAKAFIKKPSDSNVLRMQIEGMINFYFTGAQQVSSGVFPCAAAA